MVINLRLHSRQRLLFVTSVAATALFFSSNSWAQSQCANVFNKAAVAATGDMSLITELAQMKLEIDQGLAQGQGANFRIKTLAQEFPKRLSMVAAKLNIPIAEIKKSLIAEIANLQNRKPVEEAPRTSKKVLLKNTIHAADPVYSPSQTINLSHSLDKVTRFPGMNRILSVNEQFILVHQSAGALYLINRATNSSVLFEGSVSEARVSADGKSIYVLTALRVFKQLDVTNLEVKKSVQLDVKRFSKNERDFHKLDVSPDERILAVGDTDGRVQFFDLETGKYHDMTTNHWIGSDSITAVRFIDNENVIFTSSHALFKYNLTTLGEPRKLPFAKPDMVVSMGVTNDKSYATVVQMNQATSIDLKTFQVKNIEELFFENTNQQVFKEIPNDDGGYFAILTPLGTAGPRVMNPQDLKMVLFDFNKAYDDSGVKTLDIHFSPTKEKAYLFYTKDNEYLFDEWNLAE